MTTVAAPHLDVLREMAECRLESDRLFGILTPEAWYERPIAQRHRLLFYLGHLDGFDSIQICREGLGLASPDASLDALFQAGIDPDSDNLPRDTPADWPSLEQVRAYAQRCRDHVDRHLHEAPESTVYMALEHRLMHLETLAYMLHNLEYRFKDDSNLDAPVTEGQGPANEWRTIPAGPALLGRPNDGSFGWDNEYGQHTVAVDGFAMQRYSVTNGDYLQFVRQGAAAPHFWQPAGDGYFYRGMFGLIPLPLDWPVYVTQQEALAYARYIGATLPTEEQFHRAAYGDGAARYPWGDAAPAARHGNFDFRRWDPEPVTASPDGDSAFGVSQLVGNGWQWTRSAFAPFEGFAPSRTYPGYSANFFDGQHYVIKGGSPRTAARLLRASFRNWFRPDYPYVYATFRCVR